VVVMVVMTTAVAVFVVVMVVMLVLVAAAVAVLVMVMMVMLVLVAAAVAVLVVVMMVMLVVMVLLFFKMLNGVLKGVAMLHSRKNILTVKAIPRGSDDCSAFVVLTKKLYALCNFFVLCTLGVREDYGRCVLNLVVVELAEVLHIHLALIDVGNSREAIKLCANTCVLNSLDNVGKLADTRGLYNYSVGGILLKHLDKRLGEIANQRAADAARVHLGDVDACISEETAVNTDFTKLVLNKHKLFTCIRFLNKLLNESGLTCSEEARKNIYFGHFICSLIYYILI